MRGLTSVATAGSVIGFLWLALTVALTVYGQLAFKWRVDGAGEVPATNSERIDYIVRLVFEPWMITVILSVALASVTWWAALRHFELSYAYPFLGLSFVLVLFLSGVLFSEAVTAPKVIGLVLVVAGLAVGSQA